jgi:stalled ribosome rescue protein Dom34
MYHDQLLNEVDVIFRKVQTESATGSSSSSKVRTTLTIQVEAVDFDTQACVLRVKGRNVEENDYVKVLLILKLFIYNIN